MEKTTKIRRYHIAQWMGITDTPLMKMAEEGRLTMGEGKEKSYVIIDREAADVLSQMIFEKALKMTGGDLLVAQAKKKAAYNQLLQKIEDDNREER